MSTQDEQELEGKEIFGQKMSLETLPVNSPWRDKIKDWQYPDGKTEYQDGKQSPDEILQIMRDSVTEKKAADEEAEEMTDEELDAILDDILNEDEDEDDLEDEESEEDEVEEEDEDEDEEESEEDEELELEDPGLTDEELDAIIGDEEEEEEEEYDEEEEEVDPEQVATQIAELKEQIESFRFNNISDEDIEE